MPNGDGVNNEFLVFPGHDFEMISFEFRVFDRWGDAMFVTEDVTEGWNGIFRAIEMQPAVYVWYVRAKVLVCDGRVLELFRKGDVTIVR